MVNNKTKELILSNLVEGNNSCIDTLQDLTEIGFCPNLLNDDNGHWAVVFDSFQSLVTGEKTEDVVTTFVVEASRWQDSIYEALVHSLSN